MTAQYILIQATLFVMGFILGFMIRGYTDKLLKKQGGFKELDAIKILTAIVGVVVVLIWALTVMSSVVNPDFRVGFETHAIMGAIVGALFGKDIFNPVGRTK